MSRSGFWVVSLSCHFLCFGIIFVISCSNSLVLVSSLFTCLLFYCESHFLCSVFSFTFCSHVMSLIVKSLTLFLFVSLFFVTLPLCFQVFLVVLIVGVYKLGPFVCSVWDYNMFGCTSRHFGFCHLFLSLLVSLRPLTPVTSRLSAPV